MANFLYKTKGNTDPKGKPRVYFTCHPADFERYFEKILADIFQTHDCAVYYTEDMAQPMDEAELEVGLGQMNLFVVPVTFRLLSQPNRAMDGDIAYAKQENIPILPFMMEQGMDEIYAQPEKFGQRQYLNPCSTDLTEISYESKLKKYLESVLISDEMAKRIRAAFDAYIFLSYRKRDRKHANELMKLIHKNPELRDIAIWYDEFLTPGESFVDSIQKALDDSKLFALLVTPNLLEEPDGQPNFVMAEEYPAAVKAEKLVLPAEMVPTDHGALADKFPSIPDCADPQDDTAFKERLLQSLQKIAVTANDHDPEHNFLIGLAYLDGIDVEVNRKRGLELITSAADAGLMEAMKKLYVIYREGDGVAADYEKALDLAERIYEKTVRQHGPSHPESIEALCVLAENYKDTWFREGHVAHAVKLYHDAYELIRKVYGEKDRRLIEILLNLADIYDRGIVNTETLKYLEQAHALQCKIQGEEDPEAIATLQKIAGFYTHEELFANVIKAVELWEKVYALQCEVYGADAEITRKSEKELTTLRGRMSREQERVITCDKQYRSARESLGETHPKTLDALSELAMAYEKALDHEKAVQMHAQGYTLRSEVLGETHQDTVAAKRKLAHAYMAQGNWEKALQLYEQILSQQCRVLGENHPQIAEHLMDIFKVHVQNGNPEKMASLLEEFFFRPSKRDVHINEAVLEHARFLPGIYMMLHMYKKTAYWGARVYELHCRALGETAPKTIEALDGLGYMYSLDGDWDACFAAMEKAYAQTCQELGRTHKNTCKRLNMLIAYYGQGGQHQKAIALLEKVYAAHCKELGPEHGQTVDVLHQLAESCSAAGEYQKAGELFADAWKIRCRTMGAGHEDAEKALTALKECLENLSGEPGYAALYEKYAALQAELPDEDDMEARIAQAEWAEEMGDYLRSANIWESLYEYILTQGEEETLDAAAILERIAILYQQAGKHEKAIDVYCRLYTLLCRLQSEEHEDTLRVLYNLAYEYYQQGNYQKAAELFEKTYAAECVVYGPEHRDTLTTLDDLAYAHAILGNRQKAAGLYEQLYSAQRKVLGEEDTDTLRTLWNLACQFGYLQDHEKAAARYEQLYALQCQALGRDNQDTVRTLSALAYEYSNLGYHQKAAELYGQVYSAYCKRYGENDWDSKNALKRMTEEMEKAERTN